VRHGHAQNRVSRTQPGPPRATPGSVWPVRDAWNRGTENLYSAWVEKLFDAPLDEELSWPALHEVLRDKSRNFLFNHLGLRVAVYPRSVACRCQNVAQKPTIDSKPLENKAYVAMSQTVAGAPSVRWYSTWHRLRPRTHLHACGSISGLATRFISTPPGRSRSISVAATTPLLWCWAAQPSSSTRTTRGKPNRLGAAFRRLCLKWPAESS
jgi:hypothetical protein